METEKIRNLNDEELVRQEKQSAEQLFRLRFQMKLGQNEGVKKLRDLRRDVARIKTIARERTLGVHGATLQPGTAVEAKPKKAPKVVKAASATKTKKAKPAGKEAR